MKNFLICDLQFGSTGKGSIAYYLTKRNPEISHAVCAYTPNAGHTAVDGDLRFVHTALPIASAVPHVRTTLIGPGAVFDPVLMCAEAERISALVPLGEERLLVIHPAAVTLKAEDLAAEKSLERIGSTMKGTAAANWRRMQRLPGTVFGQDSDSLGYMRARLKPAGWQVETGAGNYEGEMMLASGLMVEGAQGYSLSLYHGFYPYVTSRDTTPNQIAADCGLPADYYENFTVVGCARTYPIRVANRYAADGTMTGTSGPCYEDQHEMQWSELQLEPELTTVTKLPRRLFSYSKQQMHQAIRQCSPHAVFLNFAQYKGAEIGRICDDVLNSGSEVRWLGMGPDFADIMEVTE